jgi:topoisomerase-4 subunit B
MSNYDSSAIEVLSGLEPVRKRPGMYTETEEPNHLAQEVIDNSIDEAVAGFATQIDVILHTNNSITVIDNGRGMPVDIHPKEHKPGVEVILTKLHAGGKFNNDNYKFSGGLHGVGVSVVNALSTRLDVYINREGKRHHIAFENGQKVSELQIIDNVAKKTTGTEITFIPDGSFFDNAKFNIKRLRHNLRSKAVLCSGLKVSFSNKIDDTTDNWIYEKGLQDYLGTTLNGLEVISEVPWSLDFESDEQQLSVALNWTTENQTIIDESFVNLIPTKLGGTHVNGLRTGVFEAVKEFCEFRDILPKSIKLTADDIWQKISFVLSVKLLDPQFSGQTKERLSSRQCAGFVANTIKDVFGLWLNDNIEIAEKLVQLALESARNRQKNAKKVVRKKIISGPALPGKLSDCTSSDTSKTEIFLVEGDSAGGSAKQARDKDYQAILPLRGKILNTWDVDSEQILSSNEIHDISIAIGIDPHNQNLDDLRYGKICVLADADSDGAHIATLICALFTKHFPEIIKHGHLYIAMPPLYRIDAGKEVHYALDDSERDHIIHALQKKNARLKIQTQRFKGLGEMNPAQLRETTMLPDTRRLVQLTLDDEFNINETMDMLLNKKRASDRKTWLQEKGNLAEV